MPSSRLRALAPSLAVILFASCSLVCSGVPPAVAELMYEGDSCGYSDAGKVTVQ